MRKRTHEEKARAGTLRLDKMREQKLATTQKPPRPQKYLTTSGRRIYKNICGHIIEHNILCEIDSFGISILAHNLDIFSRMVTEIEEREKLVPGSGYFQTFNNGTTQKSPQVQLMDKAMDNIFKYAKEFGLTVKSRDGILAFSKAATDDDGDLEDELNLN